jgi:hypothetical protein
VKPHQAENELRRRMGKPLEQLTPREGLDAMLALYEAQRAECAPIDEDGDMLLYQWAAEGKSFMLDLTRQFILPDEDEPYQRSLSFHFAADAELGDLEAGNEWCSSPDDLPAFRKFINESDAFQRLADGKPRRVKLAFGSC